MKIALAQTAVVQGGFDKNLRDAEELAVRAKNTGAKLVVFPEMFVGGFNYPLNLQALREGRNFALDVAQMAARAGIYIAGSMPALDAGMHLPSNRMILANPDGKIEMFYDKIHLFGVFKEDKYVSGGEKIKVEETGIGRAGLAVCYDLRFPEMFLNMALKQARIILVSSAWPHPRMEHIRILARARAIENQFFVVCVNQAGVEDFGTKQTRYGGESCAIDPWGRTLCECKPNAPDLAFCDIDFSEVEEAHAKIPALGDRKPEFYK